MQYVPVVSKSGNPLMPCHPARARELLKKGKAIARRSKGFFYIQLTEREDGDTQPIACGID
ncbi:MAG: RRXRR domain-containing protein, partial [Blastocatellia bacterium]|nr:RRXRR domain-containing protein [Blastocatellia bacterium]